MYTQIKKKHFTEMNYFFHSVTLCKTPDFTSNRFSISSTIYLSSVFSIKKDSADFVFFYSEAFLSDVSI